MRTLLPAFSVSLLLLTACGPAAEPRTATSDDGLYRVSWSPSPDPIPFAELFALDVSVNTPDGAPVTGATIALDVEMPAHGHGMQTRATFEEVGGGAYRFEGMKFHMRGVWTLIFEVTAGSGTDAATFEEAFY